MNRLAAILDVRDVQVDVETVDKHGLFERAGRLFEANHGIARATVTHNLLARERLGSTALGHGVAIPHGRIDTLRHPVAAVLRLRGPILFDAPDEEPVGLLVFLFVPQAATQQHLEILSDIAEILSDRQTRDRLKEAPDAAAVFELLAGWHPPATAVDAKALRQQHRSQ